MTNDNHGSEVFPVALLARGRPCLVVGGGRVAARKTALLLEAGATVTVVSPDLGEPLAALGAEKRVRHVARRFEDSDAEGMFLVFAATNEKVVNRQVVESCRQRGIVCCRVDKHWRTGDFVTPATTRAAGLTVSISTGGRSCRRSRLVKDVLARHLAMIENADLAVFGTSHRHLTIGEREPFHLVGGRRRDTGRMLMHVWGLHEFVVLNTCNRIELLGAVSRDAGASGIIRRIMKFDELEEDKYYVLRGYEAFEHAALLTAGLLSQTPGENHIVAQIKEALAEALAAGWADGVMREWVDAALHVSKEIRGTAGARLRAFEIEDLCLDYLTAERGDLGGRSILVLGAGTVGDEVVKRCLARGMICDWCYHARQPAVPPEHRSRVRVFSFNDLRARLPGADLIVCTASSPGHVLHRGHAPFFDQEKEILIVDLGMPRNVEPDLAEVSSALRVADLDDLKHWYRRAVADTDHVLDPARRTVAEHRDLYDKLVGSFQGGVPGQ